VLRPQDGGGQREDQRVAEQHRNKTALVMMTPFMAVSGDNVLHGDLRSSRTSVWGVPGTNVNLSR
jgi:hypothetical protein